jgi:transposase
MKPPPARMDVSRQELDAVLARVRERLEEADYEKLKAAIETLAYLTDLVQHKEISLARLRKILFGAATEKTRQVTPPSSREKRNPRPQEHGLAMAATGPKSSEGRGRLRWRILF